MKELGPGKPVTAKLASVRRKKVSEADKLPFQKEYEENVAKFKKAMEPYVPPAVEAPARKERDAEGGQDEEDDEEEEEEADQDGESAAPLKRQASTNDAPAAKKGKTGGDPEVEAEAKKLGFLQKLKSLSENPKVNASSSEILSELQKQNGSVVAAKKALLGA